MAVIQYESDVSVRGRVLIDGGLPHQFLKADGSLDSNTYALASSVHNPVTLGTANGLSLSTQKLSLGLASSGVTGALSGTDWDNFNSKQPALGFTPENVANKATTLTASSTAYPNNNAVIAGLATKEPSFTKNTAFNKNFGTTAGTVAEGNDSRINNGQTAFSWGNHVNGGYAFTTGSNINQSSFRTALGLGSNAYTSTAYLPLSGGTLSGNLNVNSTLRVGDNSFNSTIDQAGIGKITSEFTSGRSYTNFYGHTGAASNHLMLSIDGLGNSIFTGTVTASPATTANQVPTWGQVQAMASSGTYTPSNQTNAAQTVNFIRSYWEKNGNVLTVTTSLTYTVTQIQSTSSFLITLPNGFLVSGASSGRIIGSSLLHTTQGIFNNNANMKAYEASDSSKISLQAYFQATVSSGTYETTIIYTVLIQ